MFWFNSIQVLTTMHQYEADIRNGLSRFLDYLEHPKSDILRQNLIQTGPRVLNAIETLLDGLAIDLVTIGNLLAVLKEAYKVRFNLWWCTPSTYKWITICCWNMQLRAKISANSFVRPVNSSMFHVFICCFPLYSTTWLWLIYDIELCTFYKQSAVD